MHVRERIRPPQEEAGKCIAGSRSRRPLPGTEEKDEYQMRSAGETEMMVGSTR